MNINSSTNPSIPQNFHGNQSRQRKPITANKMESGGHQVTQITDSRNAFNTRAILIGGIVGLIFGLFWTLAAYVENKALDNLLSNSDQNNNVTAISTLKESRALLLVSSLIGGLFGHFISKA